MSNDSPQANSTITGPTIDRCPVCRYSLEGLPAAHRCPECGFEYDEKTRIWKPKSFWLFGGTILILVATQGPQALGHMLEKKALGFRFWLYGAVFAVWCTFIIILIRRYRAHPFVSVGPGGVAYKLFKTSPTLVPWSDIDSIDIRMKSQYRGIVLKHKPDKKVDLTKILIDLVKANEFRDCVDQRLRELSMPAVDQNPLTAAN